MLEASQQLEYPSVESSSPYLSQKLVEESWQSAPVREYLSNAPALSESLAELKIVGGENGNDTIGSVTIDGSTYQSDSDTTIVTAGDGLTNVYEHAADSRILNSDQFKAEFSDMAISYIASGENGMVGNKGGSRSHSIMGCTVGSLHLAVQAPAPDLRC